MGRSFPRKLKLSSTGREGAWEGLGGGFLQLGTVAFPHSSLCMKEVVSCSVLRLTATVGFDSCERE